MFWKTLEEAKQSCMTRFIFANYAKASSSPWWSTRRPRWRYQNTVNVKPKWYSSKTSCHGAHKPIGPIFNAKSYTDSNEIQTTNWGSDSAKVHGFRMMIWSFFSLRKYPHRIAINDDFDYSNPKFGFELWIFCRIQARRLVVRILLVSV